MSFTFFLLIIIVCLLYVLNSIECKSETIKVGEIWWGPEELRSQNDTSVRPFKVVFSKEMIIDLKHRLKNYRQPKPTFEGVGFEYGFNSREIPAWVQYWANIYPFQEREDYLNQFPQFKTMIQGLDLHFIRVVPKVPAGVKIVPLLLLHGWPGSVREFYEAIPLLTAVSPDRDFALEVVAPSLPGFGFSSSAVRPGLTADNMAIVLRNLMHRLGHEKFYVQGGDWGSFIGAAMATIFQKEVLGYHTNLALVSTGKALMLKILGSWFPSLVVDPSLADRMYPLKEKALILLRETGYMHLQATKPDTLGVGLTDSPVGLLAYIFQMFSSGTRVYYVARENGGLNHYPKEALIDNLMMYWVSGCITSSFRIYTESLNKGYSTTIRNAPTKVPTWVLQAKYEIAYHPPRILQTKFHNLLHATVLPDGGHFIALESPNIFADDVLDSMIAFRKWWKYDQNFSNFGAK